MPTSSVSDPRHARRRQHSKGRGDPFRLSVTIPSVLLASMVVGVGLYALSGGFTDNKSTSSASLHPSTDSRVTTLPAVAPVVAPSTSRSTTTVPRGVTTTMKSSVTSAKTSNTTSTTSTTTPPVTVPTGQVVVEVMNGTGVPGQATQVMTALRTAGFGIDGAANASTFNFVASQISYARGSLAAAETLAAHISGAYSLVVDESLPSGVVDFIIGSDYQGLRN